MFFTLFGCSARRGGVAVSQGTRTQPAYAVFHPWQLNNRSSGNWQGGGGPPKGFVHNLLMQFFTPSSSKVEVFRNLFFFDTVIT